MVFVDGVLKTLLDFQASLKTDISTFIALAQGFSDQDLCNMGIQMRNDFLQMEKLAPFASDFGTKIGILPYIDVDGEDRVNAIAAEMGSTPPMDYVSPSPEWNMDNRVTIMTLFPANNRFALGHFNSNEAAEKYNYYRVSQDSLVLVFLNGSKEHTMARSRTGAKSYTETIQRLRLFTSQDGNNTHGMEFEQFQLKEYDVLKDETLVKTQFQFVFVLFHVLKYEYY